MPPITPTTSPQFTLARDSTKSPLQAINELIASGKKITYKGGDFKDDRVVTVWVKDHRPLRTAMVGANVFMYVDPCHCCIPGHGPRDFKPQITDVTSFLRYIREAKDRDEALDVVFTSLHLYDQTKQEVIKISPETKLIVACDRKSGISANELRNRDIPAIDDEDYNNCAPLNAVIAFTVFNELVN